MDIENNNLSTTLSTLTENSFVDSRASNVNLNKINASMIRPSFMKSVFS